MTDNSMSNDNFIFTGTCRAGSGVVAAVTTFLASRNCYICALEQFDDQSTNKFFMRAVFRREDGAPDIATMMEEFAEYPRPLICSGISTDPQHR